MSLGLHLFNNVDFGEVVFSFLTLVTFRLTLNSAAANKVASLASHLLCDPGAYRCRNITVKKVKVWFPKQTFFFLVQESILPCVYSNWF